jgi:RNA recognition motif-containing protein
MTRIFVGNLTWATTREDLLAIFSPFGNIENVNLVTDERSGQPRGFAFIQMAQATAIMAIAQLHGFKLNGRAINVREALPESGGTAQPAAWSVSRPAVRKFQER